MTARRRLSKAQVEALIEEAIVDAYGESEQRVGFLCMPQEHLACPFTTQVLGDSVTIERIDRQVVSTKLYSKNGQERHNSRNAL